MTSTTVTLAPQNGWHWNEWLAECAGTAILLLAVVTAKDLAVRAGPPIGSPPWRDVITALAAGLAVSVVAVSAMGHRSGAHLNPALTFGLWLQRTVSTADLAGYGAAQLTGAVLGVTVARLWGPTVTHAPVQWAMVRPAASVPQPAAAGLECAAALVQLGVVFLLLTSRRHHQFAPAVAGAVLAVAVIALAPVTGGGINPARVLAPDNLAGAYPAVWIYLAAPLLGAALAAAAIAAIGRRPVTGKLHHDPSIGCHMRCILPGPASHGPDQLDRGLPRRPAGGRVGKAGEGPPEAFEREPEHHM
jgi:aquaporin Z